MDVIILLRRLVSLYLLWRDLIRATDTFKELVRVIEVELCDVLDRN